MDKVMPDFARYGVMIYDTWKIGSVVKTPARRIVGLDS